jgi:hypothetical protein
VAPIVVDSFPKDVLINLRCDLSYY